ncbi:MAG: hypothetical protein JXA52_07945, partial [Planctomycetes bacterium]|nr:hypothetical protein [Planctomycetota bacterium]
AAAWQVRWGGDPEFSQKIYPVIKKLLRWGVRELDEDHDGIPNVHGIDQAWDTFPMLGTAAYIADQWIAALLAGESLAQDRGDAKFAAWCAGIRQQATQVVESKLWNGEYYNLSYDASKNQIHNLCFIDNFTYGTLSAALLGLGEVHPEQRIRRGLQAIWQRNVMPCKLPARVASNADGTPADRTVHLSQAGGASQSNAYTPISAQSLAALLLRYERVEQGLELAEKTAGFAINHLQEPWYGQLFFSSETGKWFYGYHYLNCLGAWHLPYAFLGAEQHVPQGRIRLAPPRLPVRMPLFWKLFCGQVEFAEDAGGITCTLSSIRQEETILKELRVKLPSKASPGVAKVISGKVGEVEKNESELILSNIVITPRGKLQLRWE